MIGFYPSRWGIMLDTLYGLGLLVCWYGNVHQIYKIIKTKSTKSLSIRWLAAILMSLTIRVPKAVTSDIWVWKYGYMCSLVICLVLLIVSIYYRRKYKGE